ncbi:MAG: type III polyketide synthase [Bacteroidales bacterium]|nr:type III polyketide synthase [Bacteroidales bacterium]
MSRIISIGTSVPLYGTKQGVILNYMHDAYGNEEVSRKLNILFNHSGIETRYSVVSDFANPKKETHLLNGVQGLKNVEERMNIFKENAVSLAIRAIQNSIEKINTTVSNFGFTHLITVSCTGLYAPGIDAELVEQLNLPNDIFRTSINFLGCNAAFHALKLGDMIARTEEDAKVLIVCVELCTLHFQPKNNHDNLLSNTIFGDGAAALIITSDSYGKKHQHKGLSIDGFYSLLLSNGKNLMGWNITPVNFEMILDSRVPEFIGDEIESIILKASKKFNIQPESINNWAIHPGGKKILDTIKKQLQLADIDLHYSYKILSEYGNMSSPTILFVLNEILESQLKSNETIFSIGFGPGISIETALFTYVE